ncbi:MAG: hypothetical protein N2560_07175 [Ignavibacteria bacterium]|nr:hypothetical protein [Ignavibacteria bacterium]
MKIAYKENQFTIETSGSIIKIDNNEYPLEIEKYSDNILKISIDGEQKVVYVANDNNNCYVFIDGDQYTLQKTDENILEDKVIEAKEKDIEFIKPPMPGSVVKLLVEKGKEVEEGAPIIVVEAMKMEITLYSSINGIVSEINVEPGQQVDADKVLVVIKRNENS